MIKLGTRVEMTKGYKGIKGAIDKKTDSPYDLFIIILDNGIKIIAGPSSFILHEKQ